VPVNEIETWLEDCRASLSAALRDGAVWVNRSDAFDEAVINAPAKLTRDNIWDMLGSFFGRPDSYLAEDASECCRRSESVTIHPLVSTKSSFSLDTRYYAYELPGILGAMISLINGVGVGCMQDKISTVSQEAGPPSLFS
jgi:hypothetical protein